MVFCYYKVLFYPTPTMNTTITIHSSYHSNLHTPSDMVRGVLLLTFIHYVTWIKY